MRAFTTITTFMLCLTCSAPAVAGEVTIKDDQPHVVNRDPAQEALTLELEELWRAGGEDADDILFGIPVEALADQAGRVYVADQQLCQVLVFESDGTPAGTLSREGDGPGEVRMPVDMIFLPDGTMGLAEFFPGKITRFNLDDEPASTIEVDVCPGETGGFTIQTMAEAKNGHLLIAGSRSVPGDKFTERIHFLAALDENGLQLVRYKEQVSRIQRPHSVVHENDFLPPFPLASALGPDGRAYTPHEREDYEVAVYRPDGELDYVISRPDFSTWKRNEQDMRRITALFESWAGANPETWPEFDLKKTERAINTLHMDGKGRLWVQHSRSNRDLPEGVFLSLDLFDGQGNWQREVRLVCEGSPVSDGLRFLGDGRVLLIKGFVVSRLACLGSGNPNLGDDDTDTIEIVCYRLPEF